LSSKDRASAREMVEKKKIQLAKLMDFYKQREGALEDGDQGQPVEEEEEDEEVASGEEPTINSEDEGAVYNT